MGNSVISDGIYRISLDGQQNITSNGRGPAVLLPENGRGQEWEIKGSGDGRYTIRNASAQEFLGFDGAPDPFEPVQAFPQARTWRIDEGPRPGSVVIGVTENDLLTLGLHPALIFPPMIALSPVFRQDRGWQLQQVG
ncbi:RICIN domain-containing protein [Parafrankia sp. EUN1f]|uniref:RICIN domain-containing protein n=1 Tax=Parafrankia sp. EUN1f TaxID=102897 RepID=UPI0001C45AE0|nr:RICIN domain-containing protein [Parafrankia sp. EUN1f]EFC81930.1 hypothetical protein FrEUN1fDRAFT_4945 [Parafrankia sp. EUN1f]